MAVLESQHGRFVMQSVSLTLRVFNDPIGSVQHAARYHRARPPRLYAGKCISGARQHFIALIYSYISPCAYPYRGARCLLNPITSVGDGGSFCYCYHILGGIYWLYSNNQWKIEDQTKPLN